MTELNTINKISKTREYLDYIEEHYNNVQRAWKELKEKCKDMKFISDDLIYNIIDNEILNHDVSKLSKEEFIQYRQYFYPVNDIEKELTISEGLFEQAWEHHKEKNLHHWENWTTKEFYHPYEWEVHCVHMVCDWMAMGYKFKDTAKAYYEKNKNKIILPEYAVKYIYEIFERVYDERQ